ncbi:MAG: hypothetical protein K0S56_1554 [Microvirga sp.]|nr:hypothetical protein [Microvirga sp.]
MMPAAGRRAREGSAADTTSVMHTMSSEPPARPALPALALPVLVVSPKRDARERYPGMR